MSLGTSRFGYHRRQSSCEVGHLDSSLSANCRTIPLSRTRLPDPGLISGSSNGRHESLTDNASQERISLCMRELSRGDIRPIVQVISDLWHLLDEESAVGMNRVPSEHTRSFLRYPLLDVVEHFLFYLFRCVWGSQAFLRQAGLGPCKNDGELP